MELKCSPQSNYLSIVEGDDPWNWEDFEAINQEDLDVILQDIMSDAESLASDFLPGDEGDIEAYLKSNVVVRPTEEDGEPDRIQVNLITERTSRIEWIKRNHFEKPSRFVPATSTVVISHRLPVEFFLSLFPESLLNTMVIHTNAYSTDEHRTDLNEMKTFLGVNILMGLKKSPSLRDYWSSLEELRDQYIATAISRDKFYWLLSNLHFVDNSSGTKADKLYKIRPLLDELSTTYLEHFTPSRRQAIGESVVKYKSRKDKLAPTRVVKRGYRVWIRVDETGYVCQFQVGSGITDTQVVEALTEPLKGKCHDVCFDGCFTETSLMGSLRNDRIYACGALRNRDDSFPELEGGCDWRMTADGLLCLKWNHSYYLSNHHNPEKLSDEDNGIPELAYEAERHVGPLRRANAMKRCYAIDRKCKKWYHRFVWHFLDTTVANSYVLYKRSGLKPELDLKQFRLRVAGGLIGACSGNKKRTAAGEVELRRYKKIVPVERRFDRAEHMPVYGPSRRCAKCSTKAVARRSRWSCTVCDAGLCLNNQRNCFAEFHKQQ